MSDLADRNLSLSPSSEIPQMPTLNRQSSSHSYTSLDSPLPLHLRIGNVAGGLQQPSPRSSPSASSPSLSAFGGSNGPSSVPPYPQHHRPSLTSHPAALPVLEPKTYHDLRQQPGSGTGSPTSGNLSPHLGSTGWPSPIHPGMPSPGPSDLNSTYPLPLPSDHHHQQQHQQQQQHHHHQQHQAYSPISGTSLSSMGPGGPAGMHYPISHLRRPQSTEPDQYELRPRLPSSGAIWAPGGG